MSVYTANDVTSTSTIANRRFGEFNVTMSRKNHHQGKRSMGEGDRKKIKGDIPYIVNHSELCIPTKDDTIERISRGKTASVTDQLTVDHSVEECQNGDEERQDHTASKKNQRRERKNHLEQATPGENE